ncbi:hypothetical protein K8352_00620 [Flavobacteriaceae bacterium F89]|uniref:histidine kinase n=1 Tax=Cerina litoralis TaxID=2874477 RepID=A0AAE3ERV4_9FLAO|nr:two-component regulator propeller domain-containing protein [Cerina litoralis]MCG2459243.1 hypothetical protein [Cerina litoralis]
MKKLKTDLKNLQLTILMGIYLTFSLLSPAVRAQEIDPQYISIVDGLAATTVRDILQDNFGLLWVATSNGVQKYDGYSFQSFKNDPDNPHSLLNNDCYSLLEDTDHNIWVATGQGISKYDRDKNTFVNYDFNKQFHTTGNASLVLDLFMDRGNRLWAASIGRGIMRYDPIADQWNTAEYRINDKDGNQPAMGFATSFAEDRKGRLYTGSKHGLLVAKNVESPFIPVTITNENSIDFTTDENGITNLFVDPTGILWITARNGIYKYDPQTEILKIVKEYKLALLNFYNQWNCIGLDKEGNVWISNNFRGVLRFDGISDRYQQMKIDGSLEIKNLGYDVITTRFTVDNSGILWFGTVNRGLLKYNPLSKPFKLYQNNPSDATTMGKNAVFGLLASKVHPGTVYVGLRGGKLDVFDEKSQTFRHIDYRAINDTYGGAVRGMAEDPDGGLWLGTWGDGLIELDPNYKEVRRFEYDSLSNNSLSNNGVRVIKKDDEGNYWVGTLGGLNILRPETGTFTRIQSKMSRTYPQALTDTINQWLTQKQIVASIEKVTDSQDRSQLVEIHKGGTYLIAAVGEGDAASMADFGWLENATKDTIWSSTDITKSFHAGGAVKNRIFIDTVKLDVGNYTLRYISDDSHSYDKWNAPGPTVSRLYGIAFFTLIDPTKFKSIQPLLKDKLVDDAIKGFNIQDIEIGSKYIWIATDSDGLNRMDRKTHAVKTYFHKVGDTNSLINNFIDDLYLANDSTLWIATNGGLDKFNPLTEKFVHYTESDGLPTNYLSTIVPGDNGELWISTQSGLSQMVNSKAIDKVTFINYNSQDGLGGDNFIPLGGVRSSSGKFYFGGDHGLNEFDKISANQVPPQVILSDFMISNKSVGFMGEDSPITESLAKVSQMDLGYTQNDLSFEFSALHYANPQKNQYAHMLEGFDPDWIYDNRNYASYTNLDPGNYTFKVRASNAYGVWNENGLTLPIAIATPWWRTWWAYVCYALLIVLAIFIFDRVMRQRLLRKEREKNQEKELAQAREIEKAYHNLEVAHENLKATQAQLIQSEKMASLGELTAGIAHEIQNPLNFVNNFSEVNSELLSELKEELAQGNLEDISALADDIDENEKKISFHGKRADSIVKGMLQHSRNSSGIKESTDINALCDEYLRLAYHGLRAKDKSFNAAMETDFDPSIGKVNVVPQDLGRVVLNLITNAFYAATLPPKGGVKDPNHKPTIWVSTKRISPLRGDQEGIEIRVKDNGPGIPEDILDKIFQPFFTTKPAGQGTGLGLSMSYDIIKAHGGDLNVMTKQNTELTTNGSGTEFIIKLPL